MKQRNGFVSNSSSSSFIVQTGNAIELAKQMLEIVRNDWMDWDDKKIKASTRVLFKKYCDRLNDIGDKLPEGADGIMLPSTNYDTYILPDTGRLDRCFVTTCNNQNWDAIIGQTSITETEEELMHKVISKSTFFDVRTGLVLHYPIYPNKSFICPKCKDKYFEYYLTLDNHKICGRCHKQMD